MKEVMASRLTASRSKFFLMVTGKTDIMEKAVALAEYFGDLRFNSGEDYCLVKEEDVETACELK